MNSKKILIGFLATIFTLSLFVCGALNLVYAEENSVEISQAYLVLKDNLEFNFKAENVPADAVMKFSYQGNTYQQNATQAGTNVFTFNKVTPEHLGETITAQLYSKEKLLSEKTISIEEYCKKLLKNTSEENGLSSISNESMKTLLVNLLYYGSASQKYLAEKNGAQAPTEENLPTAQLSNEEKSKRNFTFNLSSEDNQLQIGTSDEVFWYGYGLRFDYNVQMYVEFAVKNNPTNVKAEFNGEQKSASVVKQINGYDIYKAYYNFDALSFDDAITVNVISNDNSIGQPLVYSVRSFIYQNQKDELVGELSKAVYNYGISAKDFEESKQAVVEETTPSYLNEYEAFNGVYGQWIQDENSNQKTWAQLATVGNSTGNIKDDTNGPYEYVLKEGGDIKNKSDYTKKDIKVPLSSTSYNLSQQSYFDYTYTVNTTEAVKTNVIVRMRNTNSESQKDNQANLPFQLNKTLHIYLGSVAEENEIKIPDSVNLKYAPEFEGGAAFYEYYLGIANLVAGNNTIILRFVNGGLDKSNKPSGGYLNYIRLETVSQEAEPGTTSKLKNTLNYFAKVDASCTDGHEAYMKDIVSGQLYTLGELKETTLEDVTIVGKGHVYENIPTVIDENTYEYKCLICGETTQVARTHVEGEHYLVVAKAPNKVWYIQGETLQTDRMEIYTSDTSAEGCENLAKVTADQLTYTYQHGNSFTAGDTYVSISYIDGDKVYTGKIDVTVVASADDILTIDDKDVAVLNKTENGNISQRVNDQGAPENPMKGQSAYGGTYISGAKVGDSVSFTFTSTKTSGKLTMQAASNKTVEGNGNGSWPEYTKAMLVDCVMEITLNGTKIEVPYGTILNGSVKNLETLTNRWVWTNWTTVDLGNVQLNEGENTIVVTFKDDMNYGYATSGQIDCFNIYYNN